jgi:hypothetical protein
VVRFHPTADELEMLPGAVGVVSCEVGVPKVLFGLPPFRAVENVKPREFEHGTLRVEVALSHGAWLLTLLIGAAEMLDKPGVQGHPVQIVIIETSVAVTVAMLVGPSSVWPSYTGRALP